MEIWVKFFYIFCDIFLKNSGRYSPNIWKTFPKVFGRLSESFRKISRKFSEDFLKVFEKFPKSFRKVSLDYPKFFFKFLAKIRIIFSKLRTFRPYFSHGCDPDRVWPKFHFFSVIFMRILQLEKKRTKNKKFVLIQGKKFLWHRSARFIVNSSFREQNQPF